MKAVAVTDVGKIEFVELPMPRFREYECLVKTVVCGLCNGTDLKHIDGLVGDSHHRHPFILGHEAVGRVVEVGAKVKKFKIGDLITDPVPAAEDPRYNYICAGFCEYGVMQDTQVMKEMGLDRGAYRRFWDRAGVAPSDMNPAAAAMLVTFKETYSAVKNFGVGEGADVLIYGDGPNALSLAAMARARGAAWIGMVGHWDERLERAARVARIDQGINAKRAEAQAALDGRRVDIVIDAVGRAGIIQEGFKALKRLGKLAVFGVLRNTEPALDIRAIPTGASLQMLSWPIGANDVHEEIVDMAVSGKIKPSEFYTEVDSWENIEDAVRRVRSREAFKIILTM